MSLYQANVIGDGLIDEERPVGSPPLIVGDEGLVVLYGDTEGVTIIVAATDEDEAERRIIATWGDGAYIDELVPSVPLSGTIGSIHLRTKAGFENIAHAFTNCRDPDCEIHHPEVIEDVATALSAMAWYEAGRRSALFPRCDDCGKELDPDDLRSTAPNLCDSCEIQRGYDKASR